MSGRLLVTCLRHDFAQQVRGISMMAKIGNRDVVGPGYNGHPNYYDKAEFPMPAIRFKENTPDIMVLREKEKGDWKKLSIEEKKALYRASFCRTFAEMDAPTGHWKVCVTVSLLSITLAFWVFMYYQKCVYGEPPISFDREHQLAQLERMKVLRINPITDTISKY